MRRAIGFTRHIIAMIIVVLASGVLAATLVRLSPGFGVDEQELDPSRDVAALRARNASREEQRDFAGYCVRHTLAIFRGDLGVSRSWDRPVSGLLRERWPVTARLMAIGILGGWALALAFALPGLIYPMRLWGALGEFLSGLLLCVPSAALALFFFVYAGPGRAIIAVALFPRVFHYLRGLFSQAAAMPHVLAARARGAGPFRILLWHILPTAAPQAIALLGVSVSMAFGIAVAVEVVCDYPGIGQLAWKAALARDLPLLVTLTMLVTLATQTANAFADLAAGMGREGRL